MTSKREVAVSCHRGWALPQMPIGVKSTRALERTLFVRIGVARGEGGPDRRLRYWDRVPDKLKSRKRIVHRSESARSQGIQSLRSWPDWCAVRIPCIHHGEHGGHGATRRIAYGKSSFRVLRGSDSPGARRRRRRTLRRIMPVACTCRPTRKLKPKERAAVGRPFCTARNARLSACLYPARALSRSTMAFVQLLVIAIAGHEHDLVIGQARSARSRVTLQPLANRNSRTDRRRRSGAGHCATGAAPSRCASRNRAGPGRRPKDPRA